ncbi:MAG: hypothetical protein WC196_04280, partial [Bacilli bacterium]
IEIAATSSSSLQQYLGLTSTVTINATLNSGAGEGIALQWYLDEVLSSSQTTTTFEYLPTTTGEHKIQAKYGSVASNIITVSVGNTSFADPIISAVDNDTVKITADYGLNISVNNNTVADTSAYNLVSKAYLIDLVTPMVQGQSYTFTFTKSGYTSVTKTFVYDTRVLKVSSIKSAVEGAVKVALTPNADGTYTITKPFASTDPTVEYTISFAHQNFDSSSDTKGSNISYVTTCPGTETCTAASTWNQAQTSNTVVDSNTVMQRTYKLTSSTTVGTYTHTLTITDAATLLSKSVSVTVYVVAATPTVGLSSAVYYGTSGNSGAVTSNNYTDNTGLVTTDDDDGDGVYNNQVVAGSNGKYTVVLPYNQNEGRQVKFNVSAKYFAINSSLGANSNTLTGRIEGTASVIRYLSSTQYAAYPFIRSGDTNQLPSWQYASSVDIGVAFYVDASTPTGEYTFSFTGGATGTVSTNTFTLTLVVVAPSPKLTETIIYNGQKVTAASDGSYTFYKPLESGVVYNSSISLDVANYESPIHSSTSTPAGVSGYYTDGYVYDLLLYKIDYSGPLSGVTAYSKKIAIALGDNGSSTTVTDMTSTTSPQATYPIVRSTADHIAISPDTTSSGPISQISSISSVSATGTHTITIQIGSLVKSIVIRVVESTSQFLSAADVASKQALAKDADAPTVTSVAKGDLVYLLEGTVKHYYVATSAFTKWDSTKAAITGSTNPYDTGVVVYVTDDQFYSSTADDNTETPSSTATTWTALSDTQTEGYVKEVTFNPEVTTVIGGVTTTLTPSTTDGKYYLVGTGKSVTVGVNPSGFASGSYPATYRLTCNGVQSSYNATNTTLGLLADNTDQKLSGSIELTQSATLATAGEYNFTFTIGNATKVITVVVAAQPSLEVADLKTGTQSATYFNGAYFFKASGTTSMSVTATLLPVSVDLDKYKYTSTVTSEAVDSSSTTSTTSSKKFVTTTSAGYASESFTIGGIANTDPTDMRKFTIKFDFYLGDGTTVIGTNTVTIYIQA